jgi:hypothetical protein
MIYKLLTKTFDDVQILAHIDDDGISRQSCTEFDQAYLKWVSEGNTPLSADE